MSESNGTSDVHPVSVVAGAAGAALVSGAGVSASAMPPESMRGMDPADRPGASGHRFGPDLACSECGIQWDAHQREPAPCAKEDASEAFLRRPAAEG